MASKPLSEKASRQRLIEWAQSYGTVEQLRKLFDRYDDLIKGAKTEEERKAIQTLGIIEIHEFFSFKGSDTGELLIDGKKIK